MLAPALIHHFVMAMSAIELHSINRWEASFLREEVDG